MLWRRAAGGVLLLSSCSRQLDPDATAQPQVPSASLPAPVASQPKAAPGGAIERLVERLGKTHGLWVNGASPTLESPANAKTEVVLREMFTRVSLDKGRVKTFEVLEERDVTIPPGKDSIHAARLKTDQGDVVVLMRFEGAMWMTRVYPDVAP